MATEGYTTGITKVAQHYGYETVAASQTAQVLGATGAPGDLLHSVIVDLNGGTVTVIDGSTTVLTIPATGANIPSTGTWVIDAVCKTAWKITTAGGTTCLCVGDFT